MGEEYGVRHLFTATKIPPEDEKKSGSVANSFRTQIITTFEKKQQGGS